MLETCVFEQFQIHAYVYISELFIYLLYLTAVIQFLFCINKNLFCSLHYFIFAIFLLYSIYLFFSHLFLNIINQIYSPANNILPINSFRPILSKSITITSKEHSRIFSHGTLKLKDSLKTGLRVQLKIGVFRFSTRLSPNCSQTFTYGSERIIEMVYYCCCCCYLQNLSVVAHKCLFLLCSNLACVRICYVVV